MLRSTQLSIISQSVIPLPVGIHCLKYPGVFGQSLATEQEYTEYNTDILLDVLTRDGMPNVHGKDEIDKLKAMMREKGSFIVGIEVVAQLPLP